MSIQRTFKNLHDRLDERLAQKVEQRFNSIASYVIYQAVPDEAVDTGAYVTSFSIGLSGFGGGRSRSSRNKPKGASPDAMKSVAYEQLQSDISLIDFDAAIKNGNFGVTLRNRSPHAQDVENGGVTWKAMPNGYGVFAAIYRETSRGNL
jgi:hypothetical protein